MKEKFSLGETTNTVSWLLRVMKSKYVYQSILTTFQLTVKGFSPCLWATFALEDVARCDAYELGLASNRISFLQQLLSWPVISKLFTARWISEWKERVRFRFRFFICTIHKYCNFNSTCRKWFTLIKIIKEKRNVTVNSQTFWDQCHGKLRFNDDLNIVWKRGGFVLQKPLCYWSLYNSELLACNNWRWQEGYKLGRIDNFRVLNRKAEILWLFEKQSYKELNWKPLERDWRAKHLPVLHWNPSHFLMSIKIPS